VLDNPDLARKNTRKLRHRTVAHRSAPIPISDAQYCAHARRALYLPA